jgi:hypothetical protein
MVQAVDPPKLDGLQALRGFAPAYAFLIRLVHFPGKLFSLMPPAISSVRTTNLCEG